MRKKSLELHRCPRRHEWGGETFSQMKNRTEYCGKRQEEKALISQGGRAVGQWVQGRAQK